MATDVILRRQPDPAWTAENVSEFGHALAAQRIGNAKPIPLAPAPWAFMKEFCTQYFAVIRQKRRLLIGNGIAHVTVSKSSGIRLWNLLPVLEA
jgi:hypothetical protein